MDTLSGTISRVLFFNEYTNYTVFHLDGESGSEVITGNFPQLSEGESVTVHGHFVEHKTYGKQFQAHSYEINVPTDEESLKKYLASGLFKGIGPALADALVTHFGTEVLDVIKSNPQRLTTVPKIGVKTAENIRISYAEQEKSREVMMFMQKYGISTSLALKIYKVYQDASIQIISQNPYRIIEDVIGVGFKTADKIAMALGIEPSSSFRVRAGVNHILSELYHNGDMYCEEDFLITKVAEMLDVDSDSVEDALVFLTKIGKIILCEMDENNVYYPLALYVAEVESAKRIARLSKNFYDLDMSFIHRIIDEYQHLYDITLHKSQRNAVCSCIVHGISIITGGPGTGKTTIIQCVLYILNKLGKTALLAAPTGRAAKRMSSACGIEAKTVHRLLEYSFSSEDKMMFAKNEDNLLEADCLIVDEASMIDITLLHYLLKATSSHMQLIFVGDIDQLPSVSPGNVLKDIIASRCVNVSHLDKIFRQSERSMIVLNAHRINTGRMPIIDNKSDDFFFVDAPLPTRAAQTVLDLCTERLTQYKNYDALQDIQVISPIKRGHTGVENLNVLLQEALNPPSPQKKEKKLLHDTLREGDKVMQIRNNYNALWTNIFSKQSGTGIFNGDIGIIEKIDAESKLISVLFEEERLVHYAFDEADQLMLSYAITIHKSQGSEFNAVIILVCEGYGQFLSRNLLYTALTRAKETAVLVGSRRIIEMMVKNNIAIHRKTALAERIQQEAAGE